MGSQGAKNRKIKNTEALVVEIMDNEQEDKVDEVDISDDETVVTISSVKMKEKSTSNHGEWETVLNHKNKKKKHQQK